MTPIQFQQGTISIDAVLVAEGLGIEPTLVQPLMREGNITSVCERGIDRDTGRHRLTFFHGVHYFSVVIDDSGKVIQRSTGEATDRSPTQAVRPPDG